MAHFAELDTNNIVTRVLVVNDDWLRDADGNESEELGKSHMESVHGGRWIQTSYNGNFRTRYAGIGYSYNEELNAFIPPKPYNSWILNGEMADWEAPIPMPTDAPNRSYYEWNEETISWTLITIPIIIYMEDFRSKLTLEEKILWDNPETGTITQKAAITTVKNEFPLTYDTEETTSLMDLLVEKEVFTTERLEDILYSLVN